MIRFFIITCIIIIIIIVVVVVIGTYINITNEVVEDFAKCMKKEFSRNVGVKMQT
jgi:uncharacterized protein YxeA